MMTMTTSTRSDESSAVDVGGVVMQQHQQQQQRPQLRKFFSADLTLHRGDEAHASEFKYGPGFVTRLRSKFQQQQLHLLTAATSQIRSSEEPHPQQQRSLRRVASLEHLLDSPHQNETLCDPAAPKETQKSLSMEALANSPCPICGQQDENLPPASATSASSSSSTVQSIKKLYEHRSPAKNNYKNTLQRNVNVPKSTLRTRLDLSNNSNNNNNTNNNGQKPMIPAKPKSIAGSKKSVIVDAQMTSDDSDDNSVGSSADESNEVLVIKKRVSMSAVENIRAGGTTTYFNFNSSAESNLKHLPSAKQVGVIRPITKLEAAHNKINDHLSKSSSEKDANFLNKFQDEFGKQRHLQGQQKETIIIPKSELEPIGSIILKTRPGTNGNQEAIKKSGPKSEMQSKPHKPEETEVNKKSSHMKKIEAIVKTVVLKSASPSGQKIPSKLLETSSKSDAAQLKTSPQQQKIVPTSPMKNQSNTAGMSSKSEEIPAKQISQKVVSQPPVPKTPALPKKEAPIVDKPKSPPGGGGGGAEKSAAAVVQNQVQLPIATSSPKSEQKVSNSAGMPTNPGFQKAASSENVPLLNRPSSAVTPKQTANKWHQQQNNTLQFNFSNREYVPDYIENDGLDLSKRAAKIVDTGVIRLGGVSGESGTDEEDQILARLTIRPPSPCNVDFINANIIIAGKSSMKQGVSNKKTKGRLQFDDGATTTFEYPSEKSLAEEIRIEKLAQTSRNAPISSMNGDADEEGNSHSVAMVNNDAGQLSSLPDKNTGPTENRPLSPGMHQLVGLGNYTPSSMGTKFELGVTRAGSMTGQQFSSTSGKSGGKSPPKDEIPESDFVIESEVGEKFTEAGITADLLF